MSVGNASQESTRKLLRMEESVRTKSEGQNSYNIERCKGETKFSQRVEAWGGENCFNRKS